MNDDHVTHVMSAIVLVGVLGLIAIVLDKRQPTTNNVDMMERLFRECQRWEKVHIHALNQTCQATIRTTCDNCRMFALCGDHEPAYRDYLHTYPAACHDISHGLDLGRTLCGDLSEVPMNHLIPTLPKHCRTENPYDQQPMVCDCHYERRYRLTAWFGFSLPNNSNTNHTKFLGFAHPQILPKGQNSREVAKLLLSNVNPQVDASCTSKTCLNQLHKDISEIVETLYIDSSDVTQQRYVHQFRQDHAKVLNEAQDECVMPTIT